MSSKVDILRKYVSSDAINAISNTNKRKKKEKPREASRVQVVDEDLDWRAIAPTAESVLDSWDQENEEDKPVIVDSTSYEKPQRKVGVWINEDIGSSKINSSVRTENTPKGFQQQEQEQSRIQRKTTIPERSPPRRIRHDSDSDISPPRRNDHSDADSDPSPPRRRRRSDSDSEDEPQQQRKTLETQMKPPSSSTSSNRYEETKSHTSRATTHTDSDKKGRHHENFSQGKAISSSEISSRTEERSRSASTVATTEQERKKLLSGHNAGLQSANEFGVREKELQKKKSIDLKEVNPELSGKNAETVYRDKKGKKLDMLNEFMRQQAVREGKEVKLERAQFEWGKGSVQKQQIVDKVKELEEIASQPFARTIDDPTLEKERKSVLRDGDPMAEYFLEKQQKDEEKRQKRARKLGLDISEVVPSKPKYKGPSAPPNRFRIPPGYRWDGVDRGNGFEHKLLTKMNDKSSLREDEYRWSSADL